LESIFSDKVKIIADILNVDGKADELAHETAIYNVVSDKFNG
jgi:hypothetical protein